VWNPYQNLPTRTRQGLGFGSVLLVLVIWGLLAGLHLVHVSKLPAPWDVAQAFWQLARGGEHGSLLLSATLWSVRRVAIAGVLVVAVGVPIGALMGSSSYVNAALSPLVDPFRSAPIVAVLPILVMWLGIHENVKVAFLFLGAVVYLIPMVRDAVKAVPRTYYISA